METRIFEFFVMGEREQSPKLMGHIEVEKFEISLKKMRITEPKNMRNESGGERRQMLRNH